MPVTSNLENGIRFLLPTKNVDSSNLHPNYCEIDCGSKHELYVRVLSAFCLKGVLQGKGLPMSANSGVHFSTVSASLFLTSQVQSTPKLPMVTVYLPWLLYHLRMGGARKRNDSIRLLLAYSQTDGVDRV